jgi:hypothetical protein
LWLRFFALIAVLTAAFVLLGPSFLLSNTDPSMPWNEENRILPSESNPLFRLSPDQPKLTDILRYKTPVELDDGPRGDLNFVVFPDGTIKGIWGGEYDESNGTHCVVMAASFSGNIDPSKPCIEGNRHEASKLYFITTGSYTLLKDTPSVSARGVNGFLYVRGWMDPNHAVVGELTITENKRSFENFSWEASPVN